MDGRFLLRVFAIAFGEFVVGGAIFSAATLAISAFQSGARAQYTRTMSIVPLLAFCVMGVVRGLWKAARVIRRGY